MTALTPEALLRDLAEQAAERGAITADGRVLGSDGPHSPGERCDHVHLCQACQQADAAWRLFRSAADPQTILHLTNIVAAARDHHHDRTLIPRCQLCLALEALDTGLATRKEQRR